MLGTPAFHRRARGLLIALLCSGWLGAGEVRAAVSEPAQMSVDVDAAEITRGVVHVHETIPVGAGPMTLVYPKWIPGEHSPNGPIVNLASLAVRGNGTPLAWRRDPVDLYAFHLDVPPGANELEVTFDFYGAPVEHYSSARLGAPNMFALTWNKVVLTPDIADYRSLRIAPALHLPGAGWQIGTALAVAARSGADVRFAPVNEETLIDSPVDGGLNVRKVPLGTFDGAPVELDMFADTPDELDAGDSTLMKFRNLIAEMHALYGARHFDHYTFLLTLSDVLPPEGVEHHQSSDDGAAGDFLIDPASLADAGDLLPHEFNHSWDGKYRRPADLATPNLQVPMVDDLLWVYEGMTEFYGQLAAERSGLWTKQQWLDNLAATYAELSTTTGRRTRPLLDTAVAAPVLYDAPQAWRAGRRGVDFYAEGALLWLEADGTIRRLSHGRRSLDDFARSFFGGADTGPEVVTYTRADLVAALNAVQPFDWTTFFARRIDALAPEPPDPFAGAGWRVTYTAAPSAFEKLAAGVDKTFEARFSLGLTGKSDGTISDVIPGSPAALAGLEPGSKIVAVDGRALSERDVQAQLDAALRNAQQGPGLRLLVLGGDVYRDVRLTYNGGPRYPRLERVMDQPDLLANVAAARRRR
jgi:predicted metalloprotease with PDZ domain